MARRDVLDAIETVSAPEAARVRARDRKRTTRMVVDNAGVRRILLSRSRRVPDGGDRNASGDVDTASRPAGTRRHGGRRR